MPAARAMLGRLPTLLATVALPLLMLLPVAAGWLTAPLILGGLVLALRDRRLNPLDRELLLLTSLIPASVLLDMAVFGGGANLLERPGYLLRGFLVYYTLSRFGLSRTAFAWGIAAAALTAALIALHSALILHEARVFGFRGHWNAVPFGNFSLLLGILSLATALLPPAQPRPAQRVTAAFAGLAGLTASLLSGSRGGWLSLPLLLPLLAWLSPYSRRRGWQVAVAGCGLAVIVTAIALPNVRLRMAEAVDEIVAYRNHPQSVESMNTSSGQRLAMWRWGLERFAENPLLGVGIVNFPRERAAAVARGQLPPLVESLKLANVHNELIGRLASSGVVGGASLIGFWVLGWRLFRRRLTGDPDQRYFATCGLLVLLGTGVFSMTEGLFGTGPGCKALMLLLALPAAGLAQSSERRPRPATATID